MSAYKNEMGLVIQSDLDVNLLPSMSSELKQKLLDHKPKTLKEASAIQGMTPAALTNLSLYIRKKYTSKAAA